MSFSPADHLGAAERSLHTVTREGAQLRMLTVHRTYAAAPSEVWHALTTPDRLARWFAPVTGDLRVGGRYQVEGNAGGEVLACREPELLSLTWEMPEGHSWVDVTLRPVAAGTLLQLDHSADPAGFAEFDATYGPGATGVGWELGLMGMAEHLADPEAPRPTEAELAALLDQGLTEVMREAADGWAAAAVAWGTPEEQARAAADRTFAFYTGQGPTGGQDGAGDA